MAQCSYIDLSLIEVIRLEKVLSLSTLNQKYVWGKNATPSLTSDAFIQTIISFFSLYYFWLLFPFHRSLDLFCCFFSFLIKQLAALLSSLQWTHLSSHSCFFGTCCSNIITWNSTTCLIMALYPFVCMWRLTWRVISFHLIVSWTELCALDLLCLLKRCLQLLEGCRGCMSISHEKGGGGS